MQRGSDQKSTELAIPWMFSPVRSCIQRQFILRAWMHVTVQDFFLTGHSEPCFYFLDCYLFISRLTNLPLDILTPNPDGGQIPQGTVWLTV